ATINQAMRKADLVLINQQLEDTIYTDEFIDGINELARLYPDIPFVVDSRSLQSRFQGMWHKLNIHEIATELSLAAEPNISALPTAELHQLIRKFHEKTGDPVVVSRGEYGAVAYDGRFVA